MARVERKDEYGDDPRELFTDTAEADFLVAQVVGKEGPRHKPRLSPQNRKEMERQKKVKKK